MIIKASSKPESLHRLQRLVIRSHDPSPYLQEVRNRELGYKYESELQFYLNRILHLFHPIPFVILYDLRIPLGNSSFQIDCLLLTPNFGLIIETKGASGTLSFSHNAHFFHYDKGEMSNPIAQAEEQRDQLLKFLQLDDYPIQYVVGLGHPNVFLSTDESSEWIREIVVPFNLLKNVIKKLFEKYDTQKFEKEKLIKIGYYLKANHQEERIFFNIDSSSIEPGVICPECLRLKMIRYKYKWHCHHCGGTSVDAHYQDILDWFSFINRKKISNRECRTFLQISNPSTSFNILRNCVLLEARGINRGRYYVLKD